jgi:hypothetical protein
MPPKNPILLLTVGVGNIDQLRQTLIVPLLKSVSKGEWDRVILLPSQFSADAARQFQAELSHPRIEMKALPAAGLEDDAQACFRYFDGVLRELLTQVSPHEIFLDFTRGTKVMSVAAALAAVSHGLTHLRYVVGGRRDERGVVVPGTETVREWDIGDIESLRPQRLASGS